MKDKVDILIMGSGASGAAVAWSLNSLVPEQLHLLAEEVRPLLALNT
jgi:L-2-hydroxyglutarate oxidase LhgO